MEPDLRQALIARLSSKEEELRRAAMEGLKEGLAEEDLQWLVGPLSDESWRVRKEAIDGLSRIIPSSSLVNHLVPMMDPSRELTLRNSIVEVLERMGRDAAPFILEHIGTQQQDVRKFLVDILGNIADPATLPGLLELLHDPEDNIRAAAAEALASVGDPSVCDALLKAIAVSDEWVIFSILGSLARLRSVKALPVFFQFLGDHILAKPALTGIGLLGGLQEGMRLLAMLPDLSRGAAKTSFLALGAIYRRLARSESREDAEKLRVEVSRRADETIVQFLVAQLAVSDQHEKKQDILGGLGMIGGREALDAIIALVEDEDLGWDVDLALFSAAMGDLAMVTAMLDHGNPFVRRKIVQTLERLGRDSSLPYLKGMLSDESGHVRKDAAKAVAAMGDTSCVQDLLPLLEDEYRDVAQSAAEALVQLGTRSPVELASILTPMLETAGVLKRTLLIRILTQVQAPHWQKICLQAAQDEEPEVRAAALSCLKRWDAPSAVGTIINGLADESPEVRVQAAIALEELKPSEALAPLKAALHDQDPWVRSAAISSLSAHPQAQPEDFRAFLEGEDMMMRTSAVDALGKMAALGRPRSLELLDNAFAQASVEVKRSICRVLDKVPGPEAMHILARAMEDEEPGIRIFAAHAMANRNEPECAQLLARAAESDPEKSVRDTIRSLLETV